MKTIAILTILIIIPWAGSVLSIVALVLLFQCLTDIRNLNMKLNNASLETYRSKFSSALVLRLIIAILNIVAWFFPFNYFELINLNFNPVNAICFDDYCWCYRNGSMAKFYGFHSTISKSFSIPN